MEATTLSIATSEPTADNTTPEDVTTDMTTADYWWGLYYSKHKPRDNVDATTAQPIGGGGGGSNVATIAIAVV